MFQGFREIGQRLGPFDVAMIEIGAYNVRWRDVHLGPEQAVLAHDMLGAKLMMPVHWGTFDLALHSWTEPIERVLVAAKKRGAKVAIPRPGQSFEPSGRVPKKRWWPKLPWNTAQQDPIRSSKLPVHLVSLVP
jgi:L-ascorbate metabolism protein UlaG (beta-lactamase superfamily)